MFSACEGWLFCYLWDCCQWPAPGPGRSPEWRTRCSQATSRGGPGGETGHCEGWLSLFFSGLSFSICTRTWGEPTWVLPIPLGNPIVSETLPQPPLECSSVYCVHSIGLTPWLLSMFWTQLDPQEHSSLFNFCPQILRHFQGSRVPQNFSQSLVWLWAEGVDTSVPHKYTQLALPICSSES